ncbi:MAG: hypothetical protein WD716_12120 [Fimbriimonadaceae bacterium]
MDSVMLTRALLLALAVGGLAGCRFGKLPDPNKPKLDSKYDGASLQAKVREADNVLNERLAKGEIDIVQKKEILHAFIQKQVEGIELSKVGNEQAWRFADVYRQMEDWQTTHDLYVIAVASAEDEDRRVNDTLRLAEAKARLDKVAEGIELVRSTFDVAPAGKAPILMATLYEFAPSALGKGLDLEVARLVEDAMEQHLETIVDPASDSGRQFLQARVHHLRQSWELVFRVYRESGEDEIVRGAIERADAMMRKFAIA